MIKKITVKLFLYLLLVPPILAIIITLIANRITEGMDNEKIKELIGNAETLSLGETVLTSDVGLIYQLSVISSFSHWIITGSIIWLLINTFAISNLKTRRNKNEKK